MADNIIKPEDLAKISYKVPEKDWMKPTASMPKGNFNYAANPKSTELIPVAFIWRIWGVSVRKPSAPDHNQQHFRLLIRMQCVGNISRHDQHLARFNRMGISTNGDFRFSV